MSIQRSKAFTLTELLIAMLLGLALMTMVLTAFSSLSRSARQTQQLAELQQNAQLAMSILHNEMSNMGFWGGRSAPSAAAMQPMPASPANDCAASALDSGSFPDAAQSFVTLYALPAAAAQQLNCLPQTADNSEILQLKRLIGQPTTVAELRSNRFYLETDWQHSRFVDIASSDLNGRFDYFPYQHLVLYIQQQHVNSDILPVLMRKRLARNAAGNAVISTDSLIDGVEQMHFEFGIDSDADGELNYQLSTEQMTAALWQQQTARIISLRYHLLLRAQRPDPHYVNNQRYELGSYQFIAPGDHYRRLQISSTVFFHNTVLQEPI